MVKSKELHSKLKGLTSDPKFSELDIVIYPSIGEVPLKEKRSLSRRIKEMIEENRSFGVTGNYSRDNIWSRPNNVYVIVNDFELVFNINLDADRIIILEDSKSVLPLQFMTDLILGLDEVFIMAAGKQINSLFSVMESDDECTNIIYHLELFEPNSIPSGVMIVSLDDAENDLELEQIEAISNELWGYDSIASLKTPHVAAISTSGDILGGARANAVTSGNAVVGGVKTLIEHRGKGVGTAVSSRLTEILVEKDLEVYLATDTQNVPAQRIYEKLGYKRVGESRYYDFGTTAIKDFIIGDRDY